MKPLVRVRPGSAIPDWRTSSEGFDGRVHRRWATDCAASVAPGQPRAGQPDLGHRRPPAARDPPTADQAGLAQPGQGAARPAAWSSWSTTSRTPIRWRSPQFLAFSGRWPHFLAKASLFTVPALGRLLRACDQIPVERTSAKSADALQAAVAAVEAGQAVVIYPEGTITRDPSLWPMKGRDRRSAGRPPDRLPGDPDGAVGRPGTDVRSQDHLAEDLSAQDLAVDRRRSGPAR